MSTVKETNTKNNNNIIETIIFYITFLPLVLIVLGVLGNLSSLLIFRKQPRLRQMSSCVYLSFIAVTDTLSLFGWNLEKFTTMHVPNGFFEDRSTIWCRAITYVQEVSMCSGAILLCLLTIDRYFTIKARPGDKSWLAKMPFNSLKSAKIWSIVTIIASLVLKLNIPIMYGATVIDGNNYTVFRCQDNTFVMYKIDRYVQLAVLVVIPCVSLIMFNALIAYESIKSVHKLYLMEKRNEVDNSSIKIIRRRRRRVTSRMNVTLFVLAFLYLTVMGVTQIAFAFYRNELYDMSSSTMILAQLIIAELSFVFNASLFLICYITLAKFRHFVNEKVNSWCCNRHCF